MDAATQPCSLPAKRGQLIRLKPTVALRRLPERPLVSVLTANFNYGAFVVEAIESVLRQSYQNFEIVLCDDGSSDNSVAVMRRCAAGDSRVRVLTQSNSGQAAALNAAFAASRGDIICTLDSDDFFEPTKLEQIVRAFRAHPDCGIAIHDMRVTDDQGRPVMLQRFCGEGFVGEDLFKLRVDNPYPSCSGLSLRREVALRVFPLPVELRTYADCAVSGHAALLTPTCRVPEVLANWRTHNENVSGGAAGALSKMNEAWLCRHLRDTERAIACIVEFAQRELRTQLEYRSCRELIEYRLALAIERRDRKLAREAEDDLSRAFSSSRLAYPRHRYLFWRLLSFLPFWISRPTMHAAFSLYYRRLRQAPAAQAHGS